MTHQIVVMTDAPAENAGLIQTDAGPPIVRRDADQTPIVHQALAPAMPDGALATEKRLMLTGVNAIQAEAMFVGMAVVVRLWPALRLE